MGNRLANGIFFTDNFAGMEEVKNPENAINIPMGIAQSPDGFLYVTSSATEKILT